MSVREASKNFGIKEARYSARQAEACRFTAWLAWCSYGYPKGGIRVCPPAHTEIQMGFASTREEAKCLVQKYVQANKNLDTPVSKHLWLF